MRRKYYLHQRNEIYYAELVDTESGQKLSAKSSGSGRKRDILAPDEIKHLFHWNGLMSEEDWRFLLL